jgi:thiol-disulfide isomerase/thioredoxin
MSAIKKRLPLIIQIIISGLFLLSAVAKSFPIWAFEKQLVDLGIVDWCLAPYLARLIIGLELAIAIAILQKHYLKSIVIPLTILLLAVFCVHLTIQMYQFGPMNGNCGCFGQLIPMTPLEAFIKNVVTIAMLVYLRKQVTDHPIGENRLVNLFFIYSLSALIMFFFFPFAPCKKETTTTDTLPPVTIDSSNNLDSSQASDDGTADTAHLTAAAVDTTQKSKIVKDSVVKVNPGPAKMMSKFSEFTEFSGKKVDLNEGKKIVCMFVPGCDHCRDAAKELVTLQKKKGIPPVYILFMDEELFKLPEFFKVTGSRFPYQVVNDIPKFFKLLGNGASTPGVFYLWNGNIIKSFEGTGDNQFKADELMKSIAK